jgi:hypothetical protein
MAKAIDVIGDTTGVQMRLFPAYNDKNEFTIVIGIENNKQLYNDLFFEYISPCPKKCPVSNDLFDSKSWQDMYKAAFPKRPELKFDPKY